MRVFLLWVAILLGVSVSISAYVSAQESSESPLATIERADFPQLAAADTVRTNLWLVQALMGEIVRTSLSVLPAAPAKLVLEATATDAATEIFGTVAAGVLLKQGYELYLEDGAAVSDEDESGNPSDSTAVVGAIPEPESNADYEYRYRIEEINLGYPETGRRLGIWRQWVARDLEMVAHLTVVEKQTGRLLLNDRFRRSFQDRVPSDDFDDVRSGSYAFTDAEVKSSGWNRRLEEIVVLGTLTGLVIIYFANTGS